MGYYTSYDIAVDDGNVDDDELRKIADRLTDLSGGYGFSVFDGMISTEESCKWYEHRQDLIDLSKEFPERVFTLQATGEDFDRWAVFAHNGMAYAQNIPPQWPDVDMSRLT